MLNLRETENVICLELVLLKRTDDIEHHLND